MATFPPKFLRVMIRFDCRDPNPLSRSSRVVCTSEVVKLAVQFMRELGFSITIYAHNDFIWQWFRYLRPFARGKHEAGRHYDDKTTEASRHGDSILGYRSIGETSRYRSLRPGEENVKRKIATSPVRNNHVVDLRHAANPNPDIELLISKRQADSARLDADYRCDRFHRLGGALELG
jgi:hypothetical protein